MPSEGGSSGFPTTQFPGNSQSSGPPPRSLADLLPPGSGSASTPRTGKPSSTRGFGQGSEQPGPPDLEQLGVGSSVALPAFVLKEVVTLITGDFSDCDFLLDPTAADLPKGQTLGLARSETDDSVWQIQLQPAADRPAVDPAVAESVFARPSFTTPIAIARLIASDRGIAFQWESEVPNVKFPKTEAMQLMNCLLAMKRPTRTSKVALRRPLRGSVVPLDLTESPQRTVIEVLHLPRTDRLRLIVEPRHGLAENVDREPLDESVGVGRKMKLIPQATWKAEFQFDIQVLSGELTLFHRPYFSILANQKQDFTFERLTEAVSTTTQKIRRDNDRFNELQSRLREISSEASSVNSARATAAQKNAVVSRLMQERKAAISGLERLSKSIPLTEEALDKLQEYASLASNLHLQSQVEVQVTVATDTDEFLLWHGTNPAEIEVDLDR